jgi:EAL domain-containing protein (putative c-di-GMP-specific phosphodiesterase class I)
VDAALAGSGLDPRCLELDVTEAAIAKDGPTAVMAVDQLRERGVRVTVDDFGTGFSSLGELRRFAISMLKIDASFVRDIPEGSALIPAIIALARGLNLKVAAEGVETEAQLRYLREQGCDAYQGRYAAKFIPPLP